MGNLFLIGYMASGKTTLGRALASATGREFVDLDHEIERTVGETVAALIEKKGIGEFRRLERRVLSTIREKENAVIACGGGTPCFYDNMEIMNASGTTVWLTASPERIAVRVRAEGPTRPLLSSVKDEELVERIKTHLKERTPFYSQAHYRFDAEHLENEKEIAESVDRFLQLGILQ